MTTTNTSLSIARPLSSDAGAITQGTNAPSAGDVEVRWVVTSTDSPPLTKQDVYNAFCRFWEYIESQSLAGFLE